LPWYAKIEQGIVDKPVFDRHVPDHIRYVKDLNHRGHQARTGYWKERGGGMLLFEAASLDEAKTIVAQDPLVKNGCVTYELHEWCVVADADGNGNGNSASSDHQPALGSH